MTDNDLPLFAYGASAPHQAHSPTSQAAAAAIEPKLGKLHRRILTWLESRGAFGATDEEMQHRLGLLANTQRPRRRELQLFGRVKDSGRTRPMTSGRDGVVWVACHEDPVSQPTKAKDAGGRPVAYLVITQEILDRLAGFPWCGDRPQVGDVLVVARPHGHDARPT